MDKRLRPYFEDIDEEQFMRRQQAVFAFGTRALEVYDTDLIGEWHTLLDIDEETFRTFIDHFEEAREAISIPEHEPTELMNADHGFYDAAIFAE